MLYGDNTYDGTQGNFLGWIEVGSYCDLSLTDTWQLVNIPTAEFFINPATTTIGGIAFTTYPNFCSPQVEFALDEVKLQTGFGPQTNMATVDVFSEDSFVGAASRLNFRSASGLANRVSEDSVNNSIVISPNSPKIVSTSAAVGSWAIDARDTSIAQLTNTSVSPLSISNPTGATRDGQQLILKIKDNGAPVTLSWGPAWTEFTGVTLPATTVANKWVYVTAYYDLGSGNWHVIDVKQEP